MGIWLGPKSRAITGKDFQYGGNYTFTSNGKDWELILLDGDASSLVFFKNPGNVDLFFVAGGKPGKVATGIYNAYNGPSKGGDGGDGGGCVTVEKVRLETNTNYSVTIGESGEDTTFTGGGLSYTAVSGNGSKGGDGGYSTQNDGHLDATPGGDGIFAFGKPSDTLMSPDFIGHKFGPGGGGAGCMLYTVPGNSSLYALGGESNGPNHDYGKGGEFNPYYRNGNAGYPNHGQGGGGAYFYWISTGGGRSESAAPGLGGSGIVIIRNAR